MKRNLLRLILLISLTSGLMPACDQEHVTTNADLLTGKLSKTWHLAKVVNKNIIPTIPCLADDEYTFYSDGKYLIDNKGTTYNNTFNDFEAPPLVCKDTLDIITYGSWALNEGMDTLIVTGANYVSINKVARITSDSLILNLVMNKMVVQTDYYVAKK